MRKNYKISKHPNKIYILQKYAKKNNIYKLCSNKKKMQICLFKMENHQSNLNKNTEADKLSVMVAGFVVGG